MSESLALGICLVLAVGYVGWAGLLLLMLRHEEQKRAGTIQPWRLAEHDDDERFTRSDQSGRQTR